MRQILFRGKQEDNGEWVYGAYYHQTEFYGDDCDYHYIISSCDELEDNMMCFDGVIPETVGQFTGLTDKNGKKIFEGDIVKAIFKPNIIGSYAIGTVIFENGAFKILVYKSENSKEYKEYTDENIKAYPIEHNFIDRGYSIEVIGNIHDNPELLKEGADNG